MAKQSAGILLYRNKAGVTEIFLVHPGGPFWARKDAGAWSIPKGEFDVEEEPFAVARREFREETGQEIDSGNPVALHPVKLKSGKIIYAWALEGEADADNINSNFFELEWPPRSGKFKSFPEVDRAAWFNVTTALEKIHPQQAAFIRELVTILS